jgi:hypothetical protein
MTRAVAAIRPLATKYLFIVCSYVVKGQIWLLTAIYGVLDDLVVLRTRFFAEDAIGVEYGFLPRRNHPTALFADSAHGRLLSRFPCVLYRLLSVIYFD